MPVLASASGMQPPTAVTTAVGYGGTPTNLPGFITVIENLAALIFGLMAVVMFVMAGILFLTARGAPEKVQEARGAFMWGVAGVVVGIIAFSIVAIVGSFLSTP